ncbi:MAG: glycosyltransferase family 10 [Candidatus Cloacimonetes bacterium]|nr:glycosyltransferase family 10 [Candidatus Cloacimonadota bacterium]
MQFQIGKGFATLIMGEKRSSLVLGGVGPRHWFEGDSPMGDSSLDSVFVAIKELQKKLYSEGIEMIHYERTDPNETWGYIFFNFDESIIKDLVEDRCSSKLFLVVFEGKVISPENWSASNHALFDVVFTWDRNELPDTPKPEYFQYLLPNDLDERVRTIPFRERDKLCVMVASNKYQNRSGELYSERYKAIQWFRKNRPDDFDLYGPGWDKPEKKFGYKIRNLRRIILGKQPRYKEVNPVYRGIAASKKHTISRYKFCICFENAENQPGYITEKIFDCFLSGVVPVYLGWDRADSLIPEETFIDRRRFKDYGELYSFLAGISEEEFYRYINAAREFIESPQGKSFGIEPFVEIIAKNLKGFVGDQ